MLNLNTGHISDQYHCVYDDKFATVPCPVGNPYDGDTFSVEHWNQIIECGYERHVDVDYDRQGRRIPPPPLGDEWLSGPERQLHAQIRRQRTERQMDRRRNGRATRAQREHQFPPPDRPPPTVRFDPALQREPAPVLPRDHDPLLQREPVTALQRELDPALQRELPPVLPRDPPPALAPILRPRRIAREVDDDETSYDSSSDSESDFSDDDQEFYRLQSGRKIPIGDDDGIPRTRSGRRSIPPDILGANTAYRQTGFPGENMGAYKLGREPNQKIRASKLNQEYSNSLNWDRCVNMLRGGGLGAMWAELEQHTNQVEGTIEWMHPGLYSMKANCDDNPTWNQAMGGPNAEGYWQACLLEYETLTKMGVWDIVEKRDWMNVLPGTWAFRCKRFPDGDIRKLKGRFCARGDCQVENVDYFETYAPVVNWQTVRIMLVMSLLLQLSTKQVDYTAAFVHADIDRDPEWDNMTEEEREQSGVFLHMPRGFQQQGCVLKLNKSIYGLKQSPRNFYLHLKDKLESIGFTQSESDQCLFISDKVICLVYVDDTLLYAQNMEDIDACIADLRKADMALEVEDDVAGFLGVHIDRKDDGSILMTQMGLTDRIIKALNIGDLPMKKTPAEVGSLGKDEFGDPPQGTYNYASVIGQLQYLQGHTRVDITMAVSQCARFTHDPKRSHEKALERIGQYLKGTKNRGLIFRPAEGHEIKLDCYVDADFAGLWGYEDEQDPSSVKSRTGYAIFIQGCPVIWCSRLQGDVATSTMESEYNALSMSMRDLLPLLILTTALAIALGINGIGLAEFKATKPKFKTVLHEDNSGAQILAKMEPGRITPRSKHYGVKYHWFRTHLRPNEIEIDRIDTKLQRADFLTKALRAAVFERNRKLTMGW